MTIFNQLENLLPILSYDDKTTDEGALQQVGFDYYHIMSVVKAVAKRHASADDWRRQNAMQYAGPQKQERNHLGMVQAIMRHFDTTQEFKEAMLGTIEDKFDGNEMLENLGIDTLYDSSGDESQVAAIEIAKKLLRDPKFNPNLRDALTKSAQLIFHAQSRQQSNIANEDIFGQDAEQQLADDDVDPTEVTRTQHESLAVVDEGEESPFNRGTDRPEMIRQLTEKPEDEIDKQWLNDMHSNSSRERELLINDQSSLPSSILKNK